MNTAGEMSANATTMDASLERYRIENFKNTNAKRVPYEEIDYNIYKSSHIVFSTTEKRLPLWINALFSRYHENDDINNMNIITRWLEVEKQDKPSKCDKISLSFHPNEKESILTITVNVTAGRIKAQGRLYKLWGAKEFEKLLAMVNSPPSTWDVDNMKSSVENFLKKDTISDFEKTTISPHVSEKTKETSDDNTTPNTPRDKTISQMRLQLANIEAEFIIHKENTEQTISELSQSIDTKDKEILTLKNTQKEKQQTISDLTVKLLQMEETIKALNKRCKKIEDKNSNLQQSVNKIHNELCTEKDTWASICSPPSSTTEEYSIPTSNTFDPLTDDVRNQVKDSQNHSEMKTKENKENMAEKNQQNIPST